MKIFLLTAAGVVVGLFLFLLIAFWWIKRKLRGWGNQLKETIEGIAALGAMGGASNAPFRMTLTRPSEFTWYHPEKAAEHVDELQRLGFVSAGRFSAQEQSELRMEGFAHVDHGLFAAVYDIPAEGPNLDLVCDFVDGSRLTYSTVVHQHLDHPEWAPIRIIPEASVQQLLEAVLANRPDMEWVPVEAGRFRDVFTTAYTREMDWRAERGGYKMEEVRRICKASDPNVTDELVAQVYDITQSQFVGDVDQELRRLFLQSGSVSAAEWDRVQHRVVMVHDMMTKENVAEFIESAISADEPAAEDEDAQDMAYDKRIDEWTARACEVGARAAFAEASEKTSNLKTIGTVEAFVTADVYELPEEDDDD